MRAGRIYDDIGAKSGFLTIQKAAKALKLSGQVTSVLVSVVLNHKYLIQPKGSRPSMSTKGKDIKAPKPLPPQKPSSTYLSTCSKRYEGTPIIRLLPILLILPGNSMTGSGCFAAAAAATCFFGFGCC